MKYTNRIACLLPLISAVFLCACAANPTQNAVVSKNDGAFNAGAVQSATGPQQKEGDDQQIQYTDAFSSTDGSVEFTINLDQAVTSSAVPVVEVVPHYLTGEDAKRISGVLFGDADFNEAEPMLGKSADVLDKNDILEAIQRWTPYTDPDNLRELYGSTSQVSVQTVKDAIENYTEIYETVPTSGRHAPARWKFQPDICYLYTPEEIAEQNMQGFNEQICVTVKIDEIPYLLQYTVRNEKDFKLNTIFAYPKSHYSPMLLDDNLFSAKLLRTDEPTEAQIADIGAKAQDMLNRMELGDWQVDQCYLETQYKGDIPEYTVVATAVPVINGIPAIRRPQLDNLKSEEVYASNYYLTDAIFHFSADGRLAYLQLSSPIDIKEVLNENVATLSLDELMEKAKSHLTLSDSQAYGISGESLAVSQRGAGESFLCKVNVTRLNCGMTRVKVPDTDDSYYYVPSILLSGTVDYCGKDSGKVYESSGETFYTNRIVPLLMLNAVDGSVINTTNG